MKTTMNPKFARGIHTIDADGLILGRLAVQIANKLRGKDKPYFVDHLDVGDYVTVINPGKIVVTGRKKDQKLYRRHSGYLGSMKETLLKDKLRLTPEKVIQLAVKGMLPKNRLTKIWLKRLRFQIKNEEATRG